MFSRIDEFDDFFARADIADCFAHLGLRKNPGQGRENLQVLIGCLFRDDDGKRKLPDFVIRLPEGKNLVIDSKVSLVDYDRAISADTEEDQSLALNAHAQAVRVEQVVAQDVHPLEAVDLIAAALL